MNWFHYYYLAVVAVLAVALVVYAVKKAPELTDRETPHTRLEMGILCGLLLLAGIGIYGSFLSEQTYFGYLDVGADTIDQYVPFYLGLIDSIREGTFSTWNFNFGLGSSALGYQSWLLDPFNLILIPAVLALGDAHLSLMLAVVIILKILISGVLFDRLLTYFCQTPLARILGAAVFALSGFLLLWGQHYWLGSVPVAFCALLLASEALLHRWSIPRFAAVTLLSALVMAWSPYCGFMVLLGLAIFELLRIIGRARGPHSGRWILHQCLTLAIPVICGILIAGVALLPYAQYLFGETGRVGSSEKASTLSLAGTYATEFVPLRWIPMILSRLLGDSLISSGAAIPSDLVPATTSFPYVNCYELLALGLSVAALLLLLQFAHWACTELPRKQKIILAIAALLILLYCFNNFLPALFNVFVAPKYRSAFVVVAPLCIALAVGFEQRPLAGKTSLLWLIIGAFATLAVLIWSLINTVNGRLVCLADLLCAVVIIALMALTVSRGAGKRGRHQSPTTATLSQASPVVLVVLVAFVIASSFVDGFFTTNNRVACTEDTFPEATEPNAATATAEALAYLEEIDPTFYRVEKTYGDWTYLNDALVEGYAGVTTYNSTADSDVVAFFETVAPNIVAQGSAYQLYLNDPDVDVINDLLGVKYLLSKNDPHLDCFTLIGQVGDVYVYKNEGASLLTGHAAVMSESDFEALDLEARRTALASFVVVPDDQASAVASALGTASSADTATAAPINTLTIDDIQRTSDQGVDATVEAACDSVVCLSVPHTAGWEITVDGQTVDTFRSDLGFIGFTVSAGTHTIQATYHLQGLGSGGVMSLVGLLCAVVACLVFSRLAKRTHRAPTAVR